MGNCSGGVTTCSRGWLAAPPLACYQQEVTELLKLLSKKRKNATDTEVGLGVVGSLLMVPPPPLGAPPAGAQPEQARLRHPPPAA
jgi:hypothetical protein